MILALRFFEMLLFWGIGLYILFEAWAAFRTGASYIAKNRYSRWDGDGVGFWTAIATKLCGVIMSFVLGIVALVYGLDTF